ncbi:hypothetical protein ACOMHN_036400 [Nucella lapillus]
MPMISTRRGDQRSSATDPGQTQNERMTLLIPVHKDQKPFKCGLCSFSFDIILQLDTHISEHSLTKPFQCGFCQANFNTSSELTIHVDTHRLFMCVAKGPFTESLPTKTKTKTLGGVKARGGSGNSRGGAVGGSVPDKAASASKTQGVSKQQSKAPVSLLAKRAGQYSCTVCSQSFKRFSSLKKHCIAEHGVDKPLQCEWCPARFKQNTHLIHHVESVHKSVKLYVCPICGDKFKTKNYLRHHVDKQHRMDSAPSVRPKTDHMGEGAADKTDSYSVSSNHGLSSSCSVSKQRDVAENRPPYSNSETTHKKEPGLDDKGRTFQDGVKVKGQPVDDTDGAQNGGHLDEDEALPHSFLTTSLGTEGGASAMYTTPQTSALWNNVVQDQLDMKVEMDFDSGASSVVPQDTGGMFVPENNPGTILQGLGSVGNNNAGAAASSGKYE